MKTFAIFTITLCVLSKTVLSSPTSPTEPLKEKINDKLPYLQSTTSVPITTTQIVPSKAPLSESDESPLPYEQRNSELTFEETGYEKTFMFAQNNTFIQMDGDLIQTFQLRLCREISFQFRTRLPHGLLVYHNVKNPEGIDLDPYALYVIVEKGQLKVVHVFGKHATSVTVGEGLNRDEWHSVMVRIDVHGARLIARVDESQEEVYLKGLNHDTNYGVSTNLPSVVLVGGLSSEEKLHGVKYIIESFVGCIRNVVLSSGKAASDLLPITPLIATKHENVKEGCLNKCHTRENLCFAGSRCINRYNGLSCDCFTTLYEGEQCDIYTATILTLRGSSYVSYRIYDWKDRVHSPMTRISINFKTRYDDSALFYASGESLKHQYIAASIKNDAVYIEMDFGEGVMSAVLGNQVTTHYWHNLTIFHENNEVRVSLDQDEEIILEIPGGKTHNKLLFDPEIYFGGGPKLYKNKGLASNNNFAGSLKYVFYNDVSILYELQKGNPKVHYIGVLKEEFVEADVEVIPITFPFATSHIWWPIEKEDALSFKFDFKSNRTSAVLAYSDVITEQGAGYWEIRLTSDKLSFDLTPNIASNVTHSTLLKIENPTAWHAVELSYKDGEIKLTVDYRHSIKHTVDLKFSIGDKVIIGSSLKSSTSGLIGCMRDLEINNAMIEPRHVVKMERVVGEVALDNCMYIDPCKRPNTCSHGGKCFVKDDRITCDCAGTGYIGRNCHFSDFRKSCEELALLGATKTAVYTIDIDGNGVFPPADVKCDFSNLDATKTIVEHNLPGQVDVRSATDDDFSFDITYRQFSPEMLQELISHSLYCTQLIRYDCLKAPLELHSATWFTSSYDNSIVDYLGNVKRGSCPCSVNKTCEVPDHSCNCDVRENKWFSDEGFYTDPTSLGITKMYFLQQRDLDEEARARITLGPLECVETNTQKFVVTFTTSQSYIEVPGWRKGDIAFSFRTTGEKAILLFQPPIRANYPSFMVALTGDYQLTFNFTLNTGTTRELVINSGRKLNGGEWHKIWIDYNEYHVRFRINSEHQKVDLQPEEQFGPFEGSMFIGGSTADLSKKLSVKQGLIGCFRGLVVNGEILDIYSYMSVHLSEIIKDCKPSCDPSPCKNGAQCKELWSTFECVCKNTWSHVGEFCETNLNEKALTFLNRESYFKRNYLGNNDTTADEKEILKGILKENFLINLRTYDEHSLVLYANDHFNNFINLYVNNSNEIVFLFNHGNEIINMTIVDEELNSGKSVQIAILRSELRTTLDVNNKNISVEKGVLLLDEYSNKPWINPELEILSPHRPPAPPTDYFQFNIGGYDPANLLKTNPNLTELQGYIGCVRGLNIKENLIDLAELSKANIAHISGGVLPDCQIQCDAEPCKNGGICTENFAKQESTCDCEHTSFTGEFCKEELGAIFNGESILQKKFTLDGKIEKIKLQMAFSGQDLRRVNRILFLIQTINERSYYLMVAITHEGFLQFEEDREGLAFGAKVERTFVTDARHSVYYKRNGSDAVLIIDREVVPLVQINVLSATPMADTGVNEVQIGGFNTSDPKFAVYKGYNGCLSNMFIQINEQKMKPLEEYMQKSGDENMTVINSLGVRMGHCNAEFDVIQNLTIEPTLNFSLSENKLWVVDPPIRIPYKAQFVDSSRKEEKTQVVFITLTTIFVVIIVCCAIEVYRTNLAHKKRIERETDEGIIWSKEQATKLHDSPGQGVKSFGLKPIINEDNGTNGLAKSPSGTNIVGILKNGSAPIPNDNEPIITKVIEEEPEWEPKEETLELLPKSNTASNDHSDDDNETDKNYDDDDDDEDIMEEELNGVGDLISNNNPEYLIDSMDERDTAVPDGTTKADSFKLNDGLISTFQVNKRPKAPIYFNSDRRQYNNPISYIGGPHLEPRNRNSIESVLSID